MLCNIQTPIQGWAEPRRLDGPPRQVWARDLHRAVIYLRPVDPVHCPIPVWCRSDEASAATTTALAILALRQVPFLETTVVRYFALHRFACVSVIACLFSLTLPEVAVNRQVSLQWSFFIFLTQGPRLYKQPATKSNRGILLNAVEYCVFPGVVNRDAKQKVLEKIARSEAKHFLVLFRDAGCQFRALYSYDPDTEAIIKLYGTGPTHVYDVMFDKFFKWVSLYQVNKLPPTIFLFPIDTNRYNSGGKCFAQVHTKHLTVTCDAFTIHNSLWQGKKATNLPSKKDMALVI